MKKVLLFSCASVMAAVSISPADALAIDIRAPHSVFIFAGSDPISVGEWTLEVHGHAKADGPQACLYFVEWTNAETPLKRSKLFLEELKVPGFDDCRQNSQLDFATALSNSSQRASFGFDRFQERRRIQNLLLGADGAGSATGLIAFNNNVVYGFAVHP